MATESQPQTFYAGEYRHTLDEKNRLTIPARWRRGEVQEFIIVPDPKDQFLLVMLPDEFARMITQAEANVQLSKAELRSFLRQFHARAQHGSADKQGRIVFPEDLCRQVGLKSEVALVGGRGRFEVWNLDHWKRAHEAETPTYQRVADVIGL